MNLGFDIYSLAVTKAVGGYVTCHIKGIELLLPPEYQSLIIIISF